MIGKRPGGITDMSYDIEVYGRSRVDPARLQELASTSGYHVENVQSTTSEVVVTGSDSRYAFVFSGPFSIDIEDVPDMFRAEFREGQVLYRITIENGGSSPFEVMAFANALANEVDGRVVDLQADGELSSGGAASASHDHVGIDGVGRYLHLEWYFQSDGQSLSLPSEYVHAAEGLLPAALPTRFGTFQPLSERYSRSGETGLAQYYEVECEWSRLIIKGSGLLVRGNMPEWARSYVKDFSLVFDVTSAQFDPERIERFFTDIADRTDSFFACAELNDSRIFTSVPSDPAGGWPGLPRVPQWMTWYSSEYAQLVTPHLKGRTRQTNNGLLHKWTDVPETEREISSRLSRRPWLPEKFLPQQKDPERELRATANARVRPASLGGKGQGRRPLLGWFDGR